MNGTDYKKDIDTPEQIKQVLPLVLNYLTPQVIYKTIRFNRND